MDGKKPQYWVGINSTEMALLKANGDFTTKYPKKANMTKTQGTGALHSILCVIISRKEKCYL